MNSTPKLIKQVFSGVDVITAGMPHHPLHSQILDGVSDLQGRAQAESGLMVEHGVLPHVQVPVHILVTPVQTCLMVKGSGQAATKPESVLDHLGREPLSCHPANL